jgi:uncharacterized protein (DUF362 family)
MQRREFIKLTAGTAGGFILVQMPFLFKKDGLKFPDLVVAHDGTPQGLVKKAIDELGGMSRFVKRGDVVVVKPNISWDRVPQQAATTNPEVVAEVVRLCLEAGAKKIKIFDRTLNEARRCYKRSGIEKAAEGAGASVQHVYDRKFKSVRFPEGELIKSWKVYDEVFEADRIINLPIAKHHSLSNVSLGMKNFMGYLGGNRGKFHRNFDIKITDLNTKIKADLILLDAYRMLVRNGPSGGNIADVVLKKTIVAGVDPVAVDSYGVTLFGLQPERIGFLQQAHKRGLGEIDLKKLDIKSISLDG